MLNKYEYLCLPFGIPALTGLNDFTVMGRGISSLRIFLLLGGGGLQSALCLANIGQLFQPIRLADSLGDTKEHFPMEALCKMPRALGVCGVTPTIVRTYSFLLILQVRKLRPRKMKSDFPKHNAIIFITIAANRVLA